MEYREIFCNNCNKVLGKYNAKYYPESKIAELIKDSHVTHIRQGHHIIIRRSEK